MSAITPYICLPDTIAAIDWYCRVLSATVTMAPIDTDGKVGHAEITINGAVIAMSDEFASAGVAPPDRSVGNPVTLMLEVDDTAGLLERVREAGAIVDREADQTPYGTIGVFHDPFGHRWMLHQAA